MHFIKRLYEKPICHIGVRYANVVKIMFYTAFYSVILPFGLIYSLVNLLLLYWIDKVNKFC